MLLASEVIASSNIVGGISDGLEMRAVHRILSPI